MGVKLTLYQAIETALLAIDEVEHVGLWNNQFDNESTETSFNYVAVFVQFAALPWTRTNQVASANTSSGAVSKEQKGKEALIRLHCGFESLDDNTLAFETIEPILEKIYYAVQGIDVQDSQPLRRINEGQDDDHNRVMDWTMDFTTQFNQRGETSTTRQKIDAGTLTIQVTRDLDIEPDTVGDIRTGPEQ